MSAIPTRADVRELIATKLSNGWALFNGLLDVVCAAWIVIAVCMSVVWLYRFTFGPPLLHSTHYSAGFTAFATLAGLRVGLRWHKFDTGPMSY